MLLAIRHGRLAAGYSVLCFTTLEARCDVKNSGKNSAAKLQATTKAAGKKSPDSNAKALQKTMEGRDAKGK
jgi:hypothetical protein